ncbi:MULTISPECIES: bifunctional transcriptional activator/DNA repair enzyme AdaA [Virgibacillus]|uniref:Methylphosphotriester-DNA--protein-cysteine S-methyltransferase n=2 Tax=Virgibacillus TaxID=84406 RepID=A0A024Q740_9BACI|nr:MULTISPECIES: Ada metal-binding domain-containing protein [Virgibacillus]EQB38485.1 hypothetical protein M948_07835 [Virgibacillus sp. CM-4]GGJ54975.1 AraC family transcriptional regulator [Virgibacillus kapii]CDQ38005.1 Methylphosphotriester-DNA--protein-cysteine S-methyltransferase [Virgibacillus massiliensis]
MTDLSFDEMWECILACDRTYDGQFFTAVKTTKIYCRPSCRSRKPKKSNVEFYQDIGQVEAAGYRPCKRCQPEIEHSPHIMLVRSVIAYLLQHYKERLQLRDISDHIGISSYYLERVFKEETGETPRIYLEKIRMDKAVYLLKSSDLTNLEICNRIGFHSPSNFYKVFRKYHHCSPTEFRDVTDKQQRREVKA